MKIINAVGSAIFPFYYRFKMLDKKWDNLENLSLQNNAI